MEERVPRAPIRLDLTHVLQRNKDSIVVYKIGNEFTICKCQERLLQYITRFVQSDFRKVAAA